MLAAPREATPATLLAVLTAAKPGDVVVLAPGAYVAILLRNRQFDPPLVIDARAATITGMQISKVGGLTLRGGSYRPTASTMNPKTGNKAEGIALRVSRSERIKVLDGTFVGPGMTTADGPFGEGYGVFLVGGSAIEVSNSKFSGFKSGLLFRHVDGFQVTRNEFSAMRSDGLQVAESRNGVIEANRCRATRIRDGEHPDCIQMWSNPATPPTADIVIRGNRAEGHTQGIGLFNHTRKGVNDGGFDRITIEDNELNVGYPNAIAIYDGRESVVRNNRVTSYPGAKWQARINVNREVTRCGNSVGAGPDKVASTDARCRR